MEQIGKYISDNNIKQGTVNNDVDNASFKSLQQIDESVFKQDILIVCIKTFMAEFEKYKYNYTFADNDFVMYFFYKDATKFNSQWKYLK